MTGFITSELLMLWGTPVALLIIFLEILYTQLCSKSYYKTKDTLTNFFLAGCNVLTDVLSKTAGFLLLGFVYRYHISISIFPESPWPYWISLLLLEDLIYWFMHFMDHKIRLLWAGHIHHHSSKEFNFSVGIRSAVFEPIEKFFFFIPLAWLGYHPIDILLIYVLTQSWGTFLHTRTIKKLGFLEHIFTTPSHHRVHHGRNTRYLDKNFGMFLIIWDKLFGTFEPEAPEEEVDFGTTQNIEYKNYLDLIFHEFNQIRKDVKQPISLKKKLLYIFGPPGYSHDGSRKTTRQMVLDEQQQSTVTVHTK